VIWRIIASIGAGTFLVTGFSVLTDPNCVSAGFSGSRAVTVTCYPNDYGDMSGQVAGLLSIAGGVTLGALALWPVISKYRRRRLYLRNLNLELNNKNEIFNRIANTDTLVTSVDSLLPTNQHIEGIKVSQDGGTNLPATKTCSYCAEVIIFEAIKCKHCGSSLLPTVYQRCKQSLSQLKPTLLRRDFQITLAVSLLATVLVSLTWINYFNDRENEKRELINLKESGKICVSNDDGYSFAFGCKKYPQVNFEFCGPYEFINPYWDDEVFGDYQDLTTWKNGIIQGRVSNKCEDDMYLHRIVAKLDGQMKGDYVLFYLVYTSDAENAEITNDASGSFLVRIS